jgi:hypothetical protein
LIATTTDEFPLDASLSKRIFGVQQIDMILKNGGISTFVQNRQHIVSSLVMPSYTSSNSSVVVRIVVDIAKLVLYNSGTLVEQSNSARVSMLDLQQQGGLGG